MADYVGDYDKPDLHSSVIEIISNNSALVFPKNGQWVIRYENFNILP